MGYKIKKIYVGTNKVRPVETFTQNVIPIMSANTQDGFTASASVLISGSTDYYRCFMGPTGGIHSANIGRDNWGYSQIQMPISVRPTKIYVASRHDDPNRPQYPKQMYLEGSNDGVNWTTLGPTVSNPFTAIGQTQSWDITGDIGLYTYLKLNMQAGYNNSNYWAITEWNIDGRVLS